MKILNRKVLRALLLLLAGVCLIVYLLPPAQVEAQASVESDFMAMLNTERATQGKSPLLNNSFLWTAAYLHSEDMAEQDYFSHTSLDGRTFDQRIVDAGYSDYVSLGENIAYASGEPDAAKVYDMWKNSPGHYANMMGDFSDAGLGVYFRNGSTYYTLDLGKSRDVQIPEFPFTTILLLLFPIVSIFAMIARKQWKISRKKSVHTRLRALLDGLTHTLVCFHTVLHFSHYRPWY